MNNEKRKYKRIKSEFDVRLRIKDSGFYSDDIIEGQSINVSANGILFQLDRPVEVGSVVNLEVFKAGEFDFFEGDARVIRVEACPEEGSYDIGVQFSGLSEIEEKRLDNCLLNNNEE